MGCWAIALRADVSKEDEVERMFAQAIAEFGTVSVKNLGQPACPWRADRPG